MAHAQGSAGRGPAGLAARVRSYLAWRRGETERRAERRRLLDALPKNAVGAEVGTWKGDFAAQLLAATRPQRLYLIDPWEHREEGEYGQALFGGGGEEGRARMEAVHAEVLARFGSEIERGQVLVRRAKSGDAAAEFGEGALDWAYIDGDHTYDAVKADLDAYLRALRPGGMLAGDDYGVPGWWEDGVTRAVDELGASGRCEGPTIIGSQFLFKKL